MLDRFRAFLQRHKLLRALFVGTFIVMAVVHRRYGFLCITAGQPRCACCAKPCGWDLRSCGETLSWKKRTSSTTLSKVLSGAD